MVRRHANGLGLTKQEIVERVQAVAEEAQSSRASGLFLDRLLGGFAGLLIDLGLPFPLWSVIASPFRTNFRRQGIMELEPQASQQLTFRARSKGVLVLDKVEIAPQDVLASSFVTVRFFFDDRENNVDFSDFSDFVGRKIVAEPGIWKFSKLAISDEHVLKIVVQNSHPTGDAVIAFEVNGWEI